MTTTSLQRPHTADELTPPPATRRRRRRRRLTAVVGFLAVLLVAELGARVLLSRYLDAPDGWNLPRMHAQVEAMEELSGAGGTEVLLLGSSVVGSGLDPDLLGTASARYDRAFTLWLPGAPVRSLEVMYSELADPLLDPDVVVVGLTARELNASGDGQERNVQSLVTSPALRRVAGTESQLQALDRWASQRSALVRLRSTLRDPGRLVLALQAGKQDRSGGLPEPWKEARPPYEERPGHIAQERRALTGYQADGVELDSLRRLVNEIRDDGARVVLVNMPVHRPSYDALFPRGAADQAAYEAVLGELCTELQVECIDATTQPWTEQHFTNVNHLNRAGTESLTTLVAAALDQAP